MKNINLVFHSSFGQRTKNVVKVISLRVTSIVLLIAFLNLTIGCHYYKAKTVVSAKKDPKQISERVRMSSDKYVIVHHGDNAWHIKNVTLDQNDSTIQGTLEEIDSVHKHYVDLMDESKVARYKKSNAGDVLIQVHLYISEYAQGENSSVLIHLSSIKRIDIYDKASGATVASYAFPSLLITAAVTIVLLLIFCSCPYVYTYDGQTYSFQGSLFGGAVYSTLERNDYMPLPNFVPTQGLYQLKIANKRSEHQFTNRLELMSIDHPKNTTVLADKTGNVHTIETPLSPLAAKAFGKYDHLQEVTSRDSNPMFFNEDELNEPLNNLILSFKKPISSNTGKLVINAKNSLWAGYAHYELTSLFGTCYDKFAAKQEHGSAEKNIQWMIDQGVVLLAYIKIKNKWKFIDYFDVVGSNAARDLVMPIDIREVDSDSVEIMLKSGFMFWELDYAGMDFTDNKNVSINHLMPISALDSAGKDFTREILRDDMLYLKHFNMNDYVTVKFGTTPQDPAMNRTIILHGKGYYKLIAEYPGKPQKMYLRTFRTPGAFSKFSKMKYQEALHSFSLSSAN